MARRSERAGKREVYVVRSAEGRRSPLKNARTKEQADEASAAFAESALSYAAERASTPAPASR